MSLFSTHSQSLQVSCWPPQVLSAFILNRLLNLSNLGFHHFFILVHFVNYLFVTRFELHSLPLKPTSDTRACTLGGILDTVSLSAHTHEFIHNLKEIICWYL